MKSILKQLQVYRNNYVLTFKRKSFRFNSITSASCNMKKLKEEEEEEAAEFGCSCG